MVYREVTAGGATVTLEDVYLAGTWFAKEGVRLRETWRFSVADSAPAKVERRTFHNPGRVITFSPDLIKIPVSLEGGAGTVRVSGPVILKSGKPGKAREDAYLYDQTYGGVPGDIVNAARGIMERHPKVWRTISS